MEGFCARKGKEKEMITIMKNKLKFIFQIKEFIKKIFSKKAKAIKVKRLKQILEGRAKLLSKKLTSLDKKV